MLTRSALTMLGGRLPGVAQTTYLPCALFRLVMPLGPYNTPAPLTRLHLQRTRGANDEHPNHVLPTATSAVRHHALRNRVFERGGTLGRTSQSVPICTPGGCGWRADAYRRFTGAYSAFAPAVANVATAADEHHALSIQNGALGATPPSGTSRVVDGDGGVWRHP